MAQVSYVAISALKLCDLLKKASPRGDMQVSVLSGDRLAVGISPLLPTSIIDLSGETVRPFSEVDRLTIDPPKPAPSGAAGTRLARKTGRYGLAFKGEITETGSLKELLAEGLRKIEACVPGTLNKLTMLKPRTKRIVARDPRALFDQAELAEKYGERLMDGWWYGTNNSADETLTWLRRACEYASLEWAKDIVVDVAQPKLVITRIEDL